MRAFKFSSFFLNDKWNNNIVQYPSLGPHWNQMEEVGKEVHVTTRQFTIMISGSNVEKHDVSLCLKFQGNRFNILEITAVFIYDKKNEKPTVFFSILSLNLPPIKISNFWKKSIFQGIGSRQIKSFPIDCTPLLKTIFQKNIFFKNF